MKFSVLIICYNQQNSIEKCIESVLCQKEYIHQIIIADDCSTDKTRELVLKYAKLNEQLITQVFNKKNLGAIGNYNNGIKHLEGDLCAILAGDDILPSDSVKNLCRFVYENKIDLRNQKTAIIGNNEVRFPNGGSYLYNNYKIKDNNPFKEQIRLGISTRDFGFPVYLVKKYPIKSGVGIAADSFRNLEIFHEVEKTYFINEVVSIYNAGVGITSKVSMKDFSQSYLLFCDQITSKRFNLIDSRDIRFLQYKKIMAQYFVEKKMVKSVFKYFKLLFYYFINLGNFSVNNSAKSNLKYLLPFYIPVSLFIKTNFRFKQ